MFTPAVLTWSRCSLLTTSAECIAVTRGSHKTALRILREARSSSYLEGVGCRLCGLLSLSPSVQPWLSRATSGGPGASMTSKRAIACGFAPARRHRHQTGLRGSWAPRTECRWGRCDESLAWRGGNPPSPSVSVSGGSEREKKNGKLRLSISPSRQVCLRESVFVPLYEECRYKNIVKQGESTLAARKSLAQVFRPLSRNSRTCRLHVFSLGVLVLKDRPCEAAREAALHRASRRHRARIRECSAVGAALSS